jgi:hypothetical protein
MTRMPREPHPLEPLGPYVSTPRMLGEERPDAFIWNNAEHRILEVCKTWVVHTLWWDPRQTVWREYLKCITDTGMLCVIFHDLLKGGWFLYRIYD